VSDLTPPQPQQPASQPPYAAPQPTYQPPAAPGYQPPAYPTQQYPGAAPYGVQPGYGAYAPAQKTNGLAIAAMIVAILGFVWALPFIGSLAGAIMGHIALGQIKRTGERGRGMALAGVVVGWIGLGLIVLAVIGLVAFSVVASTSTRYA